MGHGSKRAVGTLLGLSAVSVPSGLVGMVCAWLAFQYAYLGDPLSPTPGRALLWAATMLGAFLAGTVLTFALLVVLLLPVARRRGWLRQDSE